MSRLMLAIERDGERQANGDVRCGADAQMRRRRRLVLFS